MPHPTHLSPLESRIALAQAKYIGPHHARVLLRHFPQVEELMADPEVLRQIFPQGKERIIAELKRTELHEEARRIASWVEREGIRTYFITDSQYPRRLGACPDAPILLYARGQFECWDMSPTLSVVGTRQVSEYGRSATERLLGEMLEIGLRPTIISGLAYGVDSLAHQYALRHQLPTIAVLAHGLDRIYPREHSAIAREIVQAGGGLVSEYPPGTTPSRYHFVERNRIIAGLSEATLVIEAGAGSGSLTTAQVAARYDRQVLAVPGRMTDPNSQGCNELIAGHIARLVTSGRDIATALGVEVTGGVVYQPLALEVTPPSDDPILRLIAEHRPIHINTLCQLSGLEVQELSERLFSLELDGHIAPMPGGLYTLAR